MSYFLAAVAIVGTAVSMYSSKKESRAKQEAAEANAEAKRIQADELMDRFFINKDLLTLEAQSFQGSQIAAFAKGGVELGTGTALVALENTNRKLQRRNEIDRQEAEFKASQLRMGADIDTRLGSDIRSAEKFNQTSIFLNGVSNTSKARQ